MKIVAVILAGGNGSRSGFSRPKQLVKLAGRPIIAHCLERFQSHSDISEIAIVTSEGCINDIESLVNRERLTKVKRVLMGGRERYESSFAAIMAYESVAKDEEVRLLFHDAVRPLVSHGTITDVIEALKHYRAVDTAIGAADTIIMSNSATNTIQEIPDRNLVRLGQTPQGFHYEVIKQAYERALLDRSFKTTDDCGVVLKYMPEEKIFIVEGSPSNLKLTYQDDLMVIDKFMQSNAGRRVSAEVETLALSALKGKTMLVIGGTSGIGASLGELARAYGAEVVVAGRSTGTDVGDARSVSKCLETVIAEHGRIDIIANTAAVLQRQPLSTMSIDDINLSIDTNIRGVINIARLSYDHLRRSHGHLLLFASSSYTYGRAFYSTYSASKAAVVNFAQALAEEWSDDDIKVNCVCPGRSRTPMRVKAFGAEPPETLLDPIEVARKVLGILVGQTTGLIFDIPNA